MTDINHVLKRKFKEEEPVREMKNYIFSRYFFNQDIFHKNAPMHLKFGMLKDKGHIEGTASQILNLGFSFCFEKYIAKKCFPFLT